MPNFLTRSKTAKFALGQPAPLPVTCLPLEVDVYNAIIFTKNKMKADAPKSKITSRSVCSKVADDVKEVWEDKGNLPTIAHRAVLDNIEKIFKRGSDLQKIPLERRSKLLEEMESNPENVFDEKGGKGRPQKKYDFLQNLFDICTCKCEDRVMCSCTKEKKIPKREWDFLMDQRQNREDQQFMIGRVDKKVTDKIREAAETKAAASAAIEAEAVVETKDTVTDKDFECNVLPTKSPATQNRLSLDNFISECDRYHISDRAASAMATALLRDIGIVTAEDVSKVVDRSKIRRMRKKRQKEAKKRRREEAKDGVQCLGLDGKKDKKTRVMVDRKVGEVMEERQGTATVDHYTFVEEPGGRFLDFISVEQGNATGKGLGREVTDLVRSYNSEETLIAVCTDGTNVNTGWKTGAIAELERNLEKPLQRLICLLHANELGLRHVYDLLDGGFGTSGPNSFKGEIGQTLTEDLYLQDVVDFAFIHTTLEDIPEDIVKDLSRDQLLLYRYAKAIACGRVPPSLAAQKPGGLNHSRWLTFCILLFILYTRTSHPSIALVKIVTFAIQVYTVMWFKIKVHWKFTMGPRHLFHTIELINTQPTDVRAIALKVVENNKYFAHTENMLASMLEDSDEVVRKEAVDRILDIRKKGTVNPRSKYARGIRFFKVPPLQFNATHYTRMIQWKKKFLSEPPVTKELSDEVISSAIAEPLNFPKYPVHTQSVERCVKKVSEATKEVCGEEAQLGLILSRIKARAEREAFDTKKDYKLVSDI